MTTVYCAKMQAIQQLLDDDDKREEMMFSCPVIPSTIPILHQEIKNVFMKDLDDCLSIMYSSLLTFCMIRRYQNRSAQIDILELQFLKREFRELYVQGRQDGNDEYHPSRELWEIYPKREDYHCIYILVNNRTNECILVREYENLIHLFRSRKHPSELEGVSFIAEKMQIHSRCRSEMNSCIRFVREFYSRHFPI